MSKLCTEAGVHYFQYHALRHMTASILDDLGVPKGAIQRNLGHRNRQTTELCLHSIGEAERAAMDKLESSRFFQPEPKPELSEPTNMPMAYWNRKVERPVFEILKNDINQLGYTGTGRKYGVSDNAVRKWLRYYERGESHLS